MSEQIQFTQKITELLDLIKTKVPLESKFVEGLMMLFAFFDDYVQEQEGRIFFKKTPDLFNMIRDLDLSIYGIAVLRSDKDDIIFLDTTTGFSVKIYTADEWNYYLTAEPSFESGFLSPNGVKWESRIGNFFEVSSSGRMTNSRIIEAV